MDKTCVWIYPRILSGLHHEFMRELTEFINRPFFSRVNPFGDKISELVDSPL